MDEDTIRANNNIEPEEDENTFVYSEWVGHGSGMLTRRSALPIDDERSIASLWKNKYGSLEDFPWEEIYGKDPRPNGCCEDCSIFKNSREDKEVQFRTE